jgi:uncharacterized protein DUF6891
MISNTCSNQQIATLTPVSSWWQRLLNRRIPVRPADESRVTEADVTRYAESQVWPGFSTRSAAIEAVTAYFADSIGPTDPASAERAVDQAWRQRESALAAAAPPGDWWRLATAFADLERSGWVARMNFACCQTCGHVEIGDERSGGEHGYVFFHEQDSERLVGPAPQIYLSYSYFDTHPGFDRGLAAAAEATDDPAVRERAWAQHARIETAVGETLVGCLRRHGLRVDWDGSHESRPTVRLRDWRKPLPVEP